MLVSVLLWLLAAMLVGAVLVAWGWRGKRLNDHPVCAKCRFDLSGCPEGTVTCPECGAGLKHPGSTRIGQRRRRPLALGLGGLLIILPAAALTAAAAAIFTGTDLNTYKPVGVLLWEAHRADAARSTTIATELLSRYTAKKLSEGQVKTVMAAALDYQGNVSRPWATEWGDLIEAGIADDKLTEDEQGRFRAQATVLEWQVRPRVGVGDPVPILGKVKEARIGSATALACKTSCDSTRIDGADVPYSRASMRFAADPDTHPPINFLTLNGTKSPRRGTSDVHGSIRMFLDGKGLKPGRHKAGIVVHLETKPYEAFQSVAWRMRMSTEEAPDVRRHGVEIEFEVVDRAGVEMVEPTPEIREKMELQFRPRVAKVTGYGVDTMLGEAHFSIDGVPLDVAFEVVWRSGGREWPMGTFTTGNSPGFVDGGIWPGHENMRRAASSLASFDADKVDIILRPSLATALRTLNVEKIYGGEIVYKDVEVEKVVISGVGGSGSGAAGTNK